MKSLSIFLIACVMALALFAQTNTVTIKLNPNRYTEVMVDGRAYSIATTTTATGNLNGSVTITGLQPGQHEMQFVRVNPNTGTRATNTKTFNLRSNYDLQITINNSGAITLKETRSKNYNALYRIPMTDAQFSVLIDEIQSIRRANARTTAVTNAISNADNLFTTAQASALLDYVTSESKRLALAKTVYPKITDPANFSLIYDQLESQANRDALEEYVRVYNANHPSYSSYAAYQVMSDANFTALYNDVKRQWFPGAKMTSLRDAFANANNYFNINQVMQLIPLVSSEANRLELAKSAYARLVDRGNFEQMYNLFSSQSSRDELAAYVTTYNIDHPINSGVVTNSRAAMTDADFNTLYNNVKRQWFPGAKMSALRDAFANTNNYYTVYQSMQLIQLVSNEDNRLELAKSAYRQIVDPANSNLLYDLFTTQARKDELRNYINSYNYNR
jgi:hypothetical protein